MATSLNILIVEDHESLRNAIKRVLENHGHQVYTASCSEELTTAIGGQNIDLYLLDLNLPGEDGLTLAAKLRQSNPTVGIIILTARSGPDHMVQGFEAGADIYLAKPIVPNALLAAIRSLSRRLAANVQDNTNLLLDTAGLKLSGLKAECGISASEMSLLLGFIRAPGHRLDIDEIVKILDERGPDIRKSAIEVRIVRLRKKLQETGAPSDCLRSVRLKGYQLCVPITVR